MAGFNKNSATEMQPQTSYVDEVATVVRGRAVEIKFLDRVDRILTIQSSEGDMGSHHCDAEQQQSFHSRQRFRKFSQ